MAADERAAHPLLVRRILAPCLGAAAAARIAHYMSFPVSSAELLEARQRWLDFGHWRPSKRAVIILGRMHIGIKNKRLLLPSVLASDALKCCAGLSLGVVVVAARHVQARAASEHLAAYLDKYRLNAVAWQPARLLIFPPLPDTDTGEHL